jgi:hypothetical protein
MSAISWASVGKVCKEASYQKASEKREQAISILPDSVLSIIFNYFKFNPFNFDKSETQNIAAITRTCKRWYVLATAKIIAIFNPDSIKADTRTIQHSNSNNSQEVGLPMHVGCKGVYLKFQGDNFAFYHKDGTAEARFKLNKEYYFFDRGILGLSNEKIQQLQPCTAKVKGELTLSKDKGSVSFYVDPTGQSTLVYYNSFTSSFQKDSSIYFCDLNASPIIAKEIKVKEKEKFVFNELEFDGTSLLLLQQPQPHISLIGKVASLQFSFWQIKEEISNPTLYQIGHWDTKETIDKYTVSGRSHSSLAFARARYLLNNHVVAAGVTRLFYADFKTRAHRIDDIAKVAPEETIDHLCSAGESASIFNTIYSTKDGYQSGKIYEWNHISGEIKLIQALEERGPIVHMHVVGTRIIVASEKGSILIVDRNLREIIYKYERPYHTWSIPSSHVVGQANLLAVKFVKPKVAGHQREEAVVLFDFTSEESHQESTTL